MTQSPETNTKRDVFLCHAGIDKEWVKKLGDRIESEPLNGKNLSVFLDEWDIRPSENIPAKINYALGSCRFMIITLSPEMVVSPWPNAEWQSMYMDDPGGKKGTMIPALLRSCEIPPLLRPISRLDFRDPKNFKNEYAKLLKVLKNEPLPRGTTPTRQIVNMVHELDTREPDRIHEKIASNIYPMFSSPKFIWGADTKHTTKQDVYDELRRSTDEYIPPFILRERKLFSFSNLDKTDNPLQRIVDTNNIQKDYVGEWKNDNVKSQWLMQLLNRCLHLHLRNTGLQFDEKHKRYFFPAQRYGTGELIMEWVPAKRKSGRILVKAVKNPTTNVVSYWKHQAIQTSFIRYGENYFLKIQPAYTFTKDGYESVDPKRAGRLSTRWLHDAYNSRFLYDLAFWVKFLRTIKFDTNLDENNIAYSKIMEQKDRISIKTGGANINILFTSIIADISVGIEADNHPLEKLLSEVSDELPSLEDSEIAEIESSDEEYEESDENYENEAQ